MKHAVPPQVYEQLIAKYTAELKIIKNHLWRASVARLMVFIAFGAGIYSLFWQVSTLTILATFAALSIFLWLIQYSTRLNNHRTFIDHLLQININEQGMFNQQTNRFAGKPVEVSPQSYLDDLDVFGNGSLFEMLNRTQTLQGQNELAGLLKKSFTEQQSIEVYQQAISTFSPQTNTRQAILAEAMVVHAQPLNHNDLFTWVLQPLVLPTKKWLLVASFLLPIINIATLLYNLETGNYIPLVLSILVSWLCLGNVIKHTGQQSNIIGKKEEVLKGYANMLERFSKVEIQQAVLLQQLQQQTLQAGKEIKKLSQLSNLLDQRINILVFILLNSFLLYDVHCLAALERWKRQHRNNLAIWIKAVGTIECLNSLATYAFNRPENKYPTFTQKLGIRATGLYHPLISLNENVANDITLGSPQQLMLITGSNMSGKTTFLRTVGTNVLLAQCGLPVCAAQFVFSPMRLYTSIRISDSLQQHTSYFMAELKRLHYIVDEILGGQPSLVLIDEILRGTNSDDKFQGSHQFVKKLIQYHCLSLFATHDLALSNLQNQHPDKVVNYCFESTIQNNELLFDYTILPGVAKNKNASFLMKKMGII